MINTEGDFIKSKLLELLIIFKKIILKFISDIENNKELFNYEKYCDNLDSFFIYNKFYDFELLNIMESTYSSISNKSNGDKDK